MAIISSGVVIQNKTTEIYNGDIISKVTIKNNGKLYVSNGYAYNATIYDGGYQYVATSGFSSKTAIKDGGKQTVYGVAINTIISSGGSQYLDYWGVAKDTIIKNGGKQEIDSGCIYNTTISSGGEQHIYRGRANDTIISNGGLQVVYDSQESVGVTVKNGGSLTLNDSSYLRDATVLSGGTIDINYNAHISGITAKSGSIISMTGNYFDINHENNYFQGATIKARQNSRIKFNNKLTLAGNVKMENITLEAPSHTTLTIKGNGNTVQKLNLDSRNFVIFDISSTNKPNTKTSMLKCLTNQDWGRHFTINTKKSQSVGTYVLTQNLNNYPSIIDLQISGKTIGQIENGKSKNINGVTYKIVKTTSSSPLLKISLSLYGKEVWKGTTGADKHTGTVHSDIFYGGKGNDTFTGQNGRDVAVYDKTAWGKDTIAKTSGTMTLLFKDLKASDIVQKLSGTTMTITRASDANQKITVNNWSNSTHNIVFGSSMTQFNAFLKDSTPSTAQTTAAQKEVWQKAGLASA